MTQNSAAGRCALFLALAVGASVSGCEQDRDREPASFELERLLLRERGGRFEAGSQVSSTFETGSQPWSVFIGAQASPEDKLAFESASRVGADGLLELGDPAGGFCRSIPFEPAHEVQVSARADAGLVWAVYELSTPIGADELGRRDAASLATDERLLGTHSLEPATSGSAGERTVVFEPDPDCRALLAAVFSEADMSGTAGDLRVAALDLPARIERLLADPQGRPGFPPLGRARVGFEDRPSAAMGAGQRWNIAIEDGADRLELGLALAPHRPGLAAAQGVFEILQLAEDGTRLDAAQFELSSERRDRAAWTELRVLLAEGVAELEFNLNGTGEPIALIAAPRLVRPPVRGAAAPPSVVLISIDTLRSDHLGTYGYGRETSPHLDRFASGSVVFEDVWSQGAYTLPSHWSLMSGQFGSFHGVEDVRDLVVPERTGVLAAWLGGYGYQTAAFTGAGYVTPEFGFARGFDRFSLLDPVWNRESERAARFIAASPDLSRELAERASVSQAMDWLAACVGTPAFLFLHTYAPHEFDPPRLDREALGIEGGDLSSDGLSAAWIGGRSGRPSGPLPNDQRERLIDLYDAAIHQADRELAPLLEFLSERREEFVTVIVSDHGKEIGERGDVEHGSTLYEELLQVPLILSGPGIAPARVTRPAMVVDVVPTLARLCGFTPDRPIQGRDLLGEATDRVLFSELNRIVERYATRRGSQKTIWTAPGKGWPDPSVDGEETFELSTDPGELIQLPGNPARVAELVAFRDAWRELGMRAAAGPGGQREIAPDTAKALRLLGYDVTE